MSDQQRNQLDSLRAELSGELRAMREILTKELLDVVQKYIDETVDIKVRKAVATAVAGMKNEVQSSATAAMQSAKKTELALTRAQSNALATTATREATKAVLAEVNRVIAPQLKALSTVVAYHTQDTGELVNHYRQAVVEQDQSSRQKRITSGREDSSEQGAILHSAGSRILWGENEPGNM